jgi:chromosome partitioning protein
MVPVVMDVDSQCNLTQMFCSAEDIDRRSGRSVYQCFESRHFFKEPPGPSDLKVMLYKNNAGSLIDIIYGSFETFRLAVAMPGGLVANAAVQHFYNFVEKAKSEYDLIVLDTNPSATFTTLCALDAANFLVAPITMDTFSMRGIHLLTHVLKGRYPWLGNPKRVCIMPNRIPVSRREDAGAARARGERGAAEIPAP